MKVYAQAFAGGDDDNAKGFAHIEDPAIIRWNDHEDHTLLFRWALKPDTNIDVGSDPHCRAGFYAESRLDLDNDGHFDQLFFSVTMGYDSDKALADPNGDGRTVYVHLGPGVFIDDGRSVDALKDQLEALFTAPGKLDLPSESAIPFAYTVSTGAPGSLAYTYDLECDASAACGSAETVIDDFEGYTDEAPDRIFDTWRDGLPMVEEDPNAGAEGFIEGNGSGAMVGYWDSPFMEREIVHRGQQSMPFNFDNTEAILSEAVLPYARPQDWSPYENLSLWFCGCPDNMVTETERLYVAIQDAHQRDQIMLYEGPASDLAKARWCRWDIPLGPGGWVDIQSITSLHIGIGNVFDDSPGSEGVLFLDSISLTER